LNSSDEENEESKDILERFETVKSIKNRVENVLNDESQRNNNLNVCKTFLEKIPELSNIINEIINNHSD
jgi:hypothetical protein